MAIAELEARRAHLQAKVTRIRSEYEELPDIEADIAAYDRIISRWQVEIDIEADPAVAPFDVQGSNTIEVASTASQNLIEPVAAEAATVAPDVASPVMEAQAETDVTQPDASATPPVDAVAGESAPAESLPSATTSAPRQPNWKRELAGLSQREAIVKIAVRKGGTVAVAQVAQILVNVGLSQAKGSTAARHNASNLLRASDLFERVRKGVYRLRIQTEPASTAAREADRSDASETLASDPTA